MADEQQPPKVFISYSWESDGHKDWVRTLGERLMQNGVVVRLDQWHIQPGQSLTQFMEAEVHAAEFVLIVCTNDYCRKALAREGGVGYEQQIITGNIVGGKPRDQFIPLLRDGEFKPGPECSIPVPFVGIYAIDVRDDSASDKWMETLLRAIFREPALRPPPLGGRPSFFSADPKAEHKVDVEEAEAIRLPDFEIDGWHLRSGVASHHKWPETFEIPDESERRGLEAGDIVKLMFETGLGEDLGGVSVERMWVIVEGRSGPYYIGSLDNVPACSDEQDHLNAGDRVVFLPEHVISIYTHEGKEIKIEGGGGEAA